MSDERDLFNGVNTPLDPGNLIDLEKKHTPVISAPATGQIGQPLSVTIEVGKLLAHPNEPGHHIEWIDIGCGYFDTTCFSIFFISPSKSSTAFS